MKKDARFHCIALSQLAHTLESRQGTGTDLLQLLIFSGT